MPLSKAQQTIAASDSRYRVVIAGRRFGKTFLSVREMARFARFPNKNVGFVAPSYRQAKQIAWKDLKERLNRVNWVKRINESELTVYLKNGSQIRLFSGDNYESMRGLGLDFVIFDEFADIPAECWTEVIRPALSDRQGHAMFIGTPKGVGNWAKDMYDRGFDAELEDWESFSFTTIQGGNVPPEEIESAKLDLDERTFRQEYEATFETYEGVVYYNFNRDVHVRPTTEIGEKDIIHIGMDFNLSPMSAVVGIQREDGIHVVDEIIIDGSNTYEMCDEIKERYGNARKIIVYPDSSGKAGNTATRGNSDHKIIENAGFIVKSKKKNPAVKDRVASVNASLMNADGTVRLVINKKCKKVIEGLTKQTYKEGTRQPDKSNNLDHALDALGYMTHWLQPITRVDNSSDDTDFWGAM